MSAASDFKNQIRYIHLSTVMLRKTPCTTQGCFLRLDTLGALKCTEHVVFDCNGQLKSSYDITEYWWKMM